MNKLINLSFLLLAGLGVAVTVFVLAAFPAFIDLIETYVASDGQVTNPNRVVYAVYIGILTLALVLLLFKAGIARVSGQPKISGLAPHIKLFYVISLVFVLLGVFVDSSNPLYKEDGILENLTAVFSFGAAFIFLYLGLKNQKGIKALFFFGMFALLFLFAMEEISWGQRIIGWETPEMLQEVNTQQESNLHNIFNNYFEILYLIFFPVVCGIFLLRDELVKIADRFPWLGPLVPFFPSPEFYYVGFIFLFLFPFTMFFNIGGETVEPVFALVFFGYAYDLIRRYRTEQKLASNP